MSVGKGIVVLDISDDTARWLSEHADERRLLDGFVSRMVTELAANNDKGNRTGWLQMDRKAAIAEVHWHASKLAVAAKALDADRTNGNDVLALQSADDVREFAADVANCALMVLDVTGLIA